MSDKNLKFLAKVLVVGVLIFIIASLLWGFAIIATRLFIALADWLATYLSSYYFAFFNNYKIIG